jgi:hypothetical protein
VAQTKEIKQKVKNIMFKNTKKGCKKIFLVIVFFVGVFWLLNRAGKENPCYYV